jgi:hypothetical protein
MLLIALPPLVNPIVADMEEKELVDNVDHYV